MSNENNINVLVDSVGRTIVGNFKKSDTKYINVGNPAIVNIDIRQDTGQIAVQLVPYIFREFISMDQRDGELVWKFPRNTVTVSDDLVVDPALINQYGNVYKPTPTDQPATTPPPVEGGSIKVFDE